MVRACASTALPRRAGRARARSGQAAVVGLVAAAALAGLGCDAPRATPAAGGSGGSDAYGPLEVEHVPTTPDPKALAEIVGAAPKSTPSPTDPDGGTLVGTDVPPPDGGTEPLPSATAIEFAAPAAPSGPRLSAGHIEIRPGLSNPAVERMAREQIYWQLVQECRAPDGQILPPDAVLLEFVVRPDGTVDPSSVAATAELPAYRAAAECMQRKFVALPFRPPAATLGRKTVVQATLPSVD
ncbi:MAG: hypothetical protein IT373_22020 [Polyangiaceae bacterium]|nr:hypothetical protein [Polyangiaceae bacterium]